MELPCSVEEPLRALRPQQARQLAGEFAPERRGPLPQAEYGSEARRVAPQAALSGALPLRAGAQSQPGPQASQRRDAHQPDALPEEPLI